MAAQFMANDDSFWPNRSQVEEAESNYYSRLSGPDTQEAASSSLVNEIAKAREQIKQSLKVSDGGDSGNLLSRLIQVEEENKELHKVTSDLQAAIKVLEARIKSLELAGAATTKSAAPAPAVKLTPGAPTSATKDDDDDDDDDVDLFGSDDEETNAEAERVRQERLKAYNEKKAKKPQIIAKSNVILDVKPWDDETDMVELEKCVRSIEMDGLLFGVSKLVPVGYGIRKLQITTVVEDEQVSIEDLEERICSFEDYVQSVDVVAFNKI